MTRLIHHVLCWVVVVATVAATCHDPPCPRHVPHVRPGTPGATGATGATGPIGATGPVGAPGTSGSASVALRLFAVNNASIVTFVVPANVTSLIIEAWGAGGGGGGCGVSLPCTRACGGGGSGAYVLESVSVLPGDVFTLNVGVGGTGGDPGLSGSSGGTTAVTNALLVDIILAVGGQPGGIRDCQQGGLGGTVLAPLFPASTLSTANGGDGYWVDVDEIMYAGDGGDAPSGGIGGHGSIGLTSTQQRNATNGGFPGGGGGGSGIFVGANGASGAIRIYY